MTQREFFPGLGDGNCFPGGAVDASGSVRGDVFSRNLPDTACFHFCEQCLKLSMGPRAAEMP